MQDSSVKFAQDFLHFVKENQEAEAAAKLVKFAHVNTRFAVIVLNVMSKVRPRDSVTCAGVSLVLRIKGKL